MYEKINFTLIWFSQYINKRIKFPNTNSNCNCPNKYLKNLINPTLVSKKSKINSNVQIKRASTLIQIKVSSVSALVPLNKQKYNLQNETLKKI